MHHLPRDEQYITCKSSGTPDDPKWPNSASTRTSRSADARVSFPVLSHLCPLSRKARGSLAPGRIAATISFPAYSHVSLFLSAPDQTVLDARGISPLFSAAVFGNDLATDAFPCSRGPMMAASFLYHGFPAAR